MPRLGQELEGTSTGFVVTTPSDRLLQRYGERHFSAALACYGWRERSEETGALKYFQASRGSHHLYEALPLEYHVGTGGSVLAATARVPPSPPTGALVHLHSATGEETSRNTIEFDDPAHAVAYLRAVLSLNMSETARVLGVERPTVYAWVSGRAKPQPANFGRLNRLCEVARRWRRRSPDPLGADLRRPDRDGRTLLDLLLEDPLRLDLIDRFMDELRRLHRQTRQRSVGASEAASRRGLAIETSDLGERSWISGQRFTSE